MAGNEDKRKWMWSRQTQGFQYCFEVANAVQKIFKLTVRKTGGGEEISREVPYDALGNALPYVQTAMREFTVKSIERSETERARRIQQADERFRREYRDGIPPEGRPVETGSVGEPVGNAEAVPGETGSESTGCSGDREDSPAADPEDSGTGAPGLQSEPEAPTRAARARGRGRGRRKGADGDPITDRDGRTQSSE